MTKKCEGDYAPGEICVARAIKKSTSGQYSHPRGGRLVIEGLAEFLSGLGPSEGIKATDEEWDFIRDYACQLITLHGTRNEPSES